MTDNDVYYSPGANKNQLLEAIQQSNFQVNQSINQLTTNMSARFESMEFNFNSFKQDITHRTSNLEANHTQVTTAINATQSTISEIKQQNINLNERLTVVEKNKQQYTNKNDPNKVYQTKFFNWRFANCAPEDLITRWGMREFIDDSIIDIEYKKSGKTIVTLKDGRAKYRFSCIIKTFLPKIQQDGVRLDEKYLNWISRECKTVQEWNEEELTVFREKPGNNSNNSNNQNFQ